MVVLVAVPVAVFAAARPPGDFRWTLASRGSIVKLFSGGPLMGAR